MNEYDKTRRGWYNECKRLMDENARLAGKVVSDDRQDEIDDLKKRNVRLSTSLENVMKNNDEWQDECVKMRGAVVTMAKLLNEKVGV